MFIVVIILTIVSCLQAHNIPVQMSRSGSVLTISGVGRWIDRGLNKLMGGPEQPPHSGPGSSGSTQSEIDPYVAKSKHRRNTSDQHLGSETPKVGEDPVEIITKIILMMIVIVIMPVTSVWGLIPPRWVKSLQDNCQHHYKNHTDDDTDTDNASDHHDDGNDNDDDNDSDNGNSEDRCDSRCLLVSFQE